MESKLVILCNDQNTVHHVIDELRAFQLTDHGRTLADIIVQTCRS